MPAFLEKDSNCNVMMGRGVVHQTTWCYCAQVVSRPSKEGWTVSGKLLAHVSRHI